VVRGLRSGPKRNRYWIVLGTLVLAVTAWVALTFDLDWAGYVGAALYSVLLLLPNALTRRMERLVVQGKFRDARILAHFTKLVHPTREYFQFPRLFSALEEAKKPSAVSTELRLKKWNHIESTLGRIAISLRFSLEGDWDGFLRWASQIGGVALFREHSALLTLYLRALGETGQLNELVATFRNERETLSSFGSWALSMGRLSLFAFTGNRAGVQELFARSLSGYPQANQLFWLSTADEALGNHEDAERNFRLLVAAEDPRIRKGAERRLAHPLSHTEGLLSDEQRLWIYEEQALITAARPNRTAESSRTVQRPYATILLVVLNCLMFLLELSAGNPESNETLIPLGALIPEAVAAGQWWRLIAATFLHAGFLHLGMNMFALYLIGPFVEFSLGRLRYLVLYLGAGVLSMLIVTELAWHNVLHDQLLVGASGAIMGLIGATAAIFLKIWHRTRAPMASQKLGSLAMALIIQTAFDAATPQISMSAHLSGAFCGFVIGLIL
jgi:rhomboid protease GluP